MTLPQVLPWAKPLWQRLVAQHQQATLPHAILLSGHTGIGKSEFAQAFAHFLLCHRPSMGKPCGVCRSCELLSSATHPDLVYLHPEEPGKPIKVDQVRELLNFLHTTAQQGGYRVVVMEPAESMNLSAANALLKSLEEPGDNTLLLLVSHMPGQLMPTIRSRCQQITFPFPNQDQAVEWLVTELDQTPERVHQLLSISQGAPLKAKQLFQQDLLSLRSLFMTCLADLLKARKSALEVAEKLYKEELLCLLDWLHSLVVDLVRLQADPETHSISNKDMIKMLTAVAHRASPGAVFDLLDQIQTERIHLLQRLNPNKQLSLETLLLRWVRLVR